MCKIALWTVLLAGLCPSAASAQENLPSATFNVSGTAIFGYCVYNNRLFSLGAKFCAQKGITEECQRTGEESAHWVSQADPACDAHPSTSPQ